MVKLDPCRRDLLTAGFIPFFVIFVSIAAPDSAAAQEKEPEPAAAQQSGPDSVAEGKKERPTTKDKSKEAKSTKEDESTKEATESKSVQDKSQSSDISPGDVEEFTVVGSRRAGRSDESSLAPVDVLKSEDLRHQGAFNLNDMLRTTVPSFAINEHPISDEAMLVRPPNLRGLPPDHVVVLVNGKRRHRGSVISFQGGGVSDGAQGVDLAAIPSIAIKRLEILRDGAAAQYGADAIAGVMNFALKDSPSGMSVESKFGSTYSGDGHQWSIAANLGVPLGKKGFLNLSAEYGLADPTNRSVQREQAAAQKENGNEGIKDPAQIWGLPTVHYDFKLFANSGYQVTPSMKIYLFGNYSRRKMMNGFYYRNPNGKDGVFTRKIEEYDKSGEKKEVNERLMVPLPKYQDDPDVKAVCYFPRVTDPNEYLQANLSPLVSEHEDKCFAFNKRFPAGFTPQFGGSVTDYGVVGGLKGRLDFGLAWDLSFSLGGNEIEFRIEDTVNASLGPDSPTIFHPGGYDQRDLTVNLDLVYPLELGFLDSPLNIAGGAEFREESFTARRGDPKSFENGSYAQHGFSRGSNGFPGIDDTQAGIFKQRNIALYLDLEAGILESLSAGLAGRLEYFDTFGATATFKVAARYQILRDFWKFEDLSLRATFGTGFRAPTPGQRNILKISTRGQPDGTLSDEAILPPEHPVSAEYGGKPLQPETSLNFSAGIVARLTTGGVLTVDYYRIHVSDRISQSPKIEITEAKKEALSKKVAGSQDWDYVKYYANAFDTVTQGVDVVASQQLPPTPIGDFSFSLAYNWNETSVGADRNRPTQAEEAELTAWKKRNIFLEKGLPRHRMVLGLNYGIAAFGFLARASFFGSFDNPEHAPKDWDTESFGGKVLFDIEARYAISKNLTIAAGVQNLFDVFPDERSSKENDGQLYPETSPFGTMGGHYYVRAKATF